MNSLSNALLRDRALALVRNDWAKIRRDMKWPDTVEIATGRIEGFLDYCKQRQIPLTAPAVLNEAGQSIDYAIAQIEDATLFGSTLEIETVDNVLLADGLSNHSGKHLVHLMHSGAVVVTGKRFARTHRPVVKHSGPHFLVGGSPNFGHWLYNYLSRTIYVKHIPISDENLKFVVHSSVTTKQIDTLRAVGIEERCIVKIDDAHDHRFERIWLSSLLTRHTKRHGGLTIHASVVDLLQQMAVAIDREPELQPRRRIYLSRARAKKRRLLATRQIDAILVRYGFETIFAESLSLADEISLVRAASVIVAPFGAAMAMLLFCRPGTTIIELKYKPAGFDWLPILADRLGISNIEIIGRPMRDKGSPYDWDFEIDPIDLDRALARVVPA